MAVHSFHKREKKERISPFGIAILVLLFAYAVMLLGLIVWGLLTSVKSADEYGNIINSGMYRFPERIVFHVKEVMEAMKKSASADSLITMDKVSFLEVFVYSLLFAGGCAFFKTLVTCLTAYACARFNFKSSKVIYSIVIITMAVPIVGNLPSELYMVHTLNLYDHIWGVWILRANFLGLYFLVMYNGYKGMPASLFEAAKLDGANNLQLLWYIALPLMKGTFAMVFLIYFVEYWNEYQVPMVYLPSFPTLGYTVYDTIFGSLKQEIRDVPSQLTLAFIVVLPIVILFLLFQNKLMGNITVGSVKG